MTVHINDYGERMVSISDTKWFAEERSHMKMAFAPVIPALTTMFWFNRDIKCNMCQHLYENGEDGPCCVKCGDMRWGPDGDRP